MVNVQSKYINESTTFRILQCSAVRLEKENIKLIKIEQFKNVLPIVYIFTTSRTKREGYWVSVLGTVVCFYSLQHP